MYTISNNGDTCILDNVKKEEGKLVAIWFCKKINKYAYSFSTLVPPVLDDFKFNSSAKAYSKGLINYPVKEDNSNES